MWPYSSLYRQILPEGISRKAVGRRGDQGLQNGVAGEKFSPAMPGRYWFFSRS
jgi:hypothetical protein